MTKSEFIEAYRRAYNEDPPEQLIQEYLGEEEHERHSYHSSRHERYPRNASDELLLEISSVFTGIGRSAKRSFENNGILSKDNSLSEVHFVVLFLIAKGFLYMLFRRSYEAGLDLSGL